MAKLNSTKAMQTSTLVEQRNKVMRQVFEGAKPTIERLAIISGRVIDELRVLAAQENWLPIQDGAVLRRRLSALSDRALALMEEPDEDALLSKTRLDAITSLLKAIDRLKAAIVDLIDEVSVDHDEAALTKAFAIIDQRIEHLAEAHAKKLVQSQSDS